LGYAGGWGRFEQSGGTFLADTVTIGQQGTGIAQVSGGHFAIGTNGIEVGLRNGADGELRVDDAGALASTTGSLRVGNEGTGAVLMQAGQLRTGGVVIGLFGEGTWSHEGGLYDQLFGDFVVGHGAGDVDMAIPGGRHGELTVSGGFLHPAGDVVLGAERGNGTVVVYGGTLAATGTPTSSIIVGQGSGASSSGPSELRVRGDQSTLLANGDFWMNPNGVADSSLLVAEIIGPNHTPIRVGGDAHLSQGTLKVELNGYVVSPHDSWVLIEAGADFSNALALMDSAIDASGYQGVTHAVPSLAGRVVDEFWRVDTSEAILPDGLDWQVSYTEHAVTLSVLAVPEPTWGLGGIPLLLWLLRRRRTR
ncbi:MAG: hypothetical protein KDA60_22395, partial [Planctomycetales bacterium]|nr:hypothetical protein [Planctomycetales bacterium]